MQNNAEDIQNLPIDITYSRLVEWLVDRKRIPGDWRKKFNSLRSRIAKALEYLPKHLDASFATLDLDGVGYLEAKHISKTLLESNPELNIFGRLAGAAAEWEGIVRAYEKDSLYLGEAAQIIVQYVNYEIPYGKKQIQKIQQQLQDLDRKETELKRNANASALKYEEACQELGLRGKNVRAELLHTAKSLPTIFAEILNTLRSDSVQTALGYYQTFVDHSHTEQGKAPSLVLSTIRDILQNPPILDVCPSPEVSGALVSSSTILSPDNENPNNVEPILSNEIDWNVESSLSNEIDWDIGMVACESSETNFEPDSVQKLETYGNPEKENLSYAKDSALHDTGSVNGIHSIDESLDKIGEVESFQSEICWDISIEDTTAAVKAGIPEQETLKDVNEKTFSVIEEGKCLKSPFLETEYRSKLVDDLLELKAFLSQRVAEMESEETATMQNQVQAVASPALQQYGSDSLRNMSSSVSQALNLLICRKTCDLIMILNSKRFLDRLESSLNQKKQYEVKLLENLNDLTRRRIDLRNSLSSLWPKQEETLSKTRELKTLIEKSLSAMFGGRPVNIIGEINVLIGQA